MKIVHRVRTGTADESLLPLALTELDEVVDREQNLHLC